MNESSISAINGTINLEGNKVLRIVRARLERD